jgi:hypothetical protein
VTPVSFFELMIRPLLEALTLPYKKTDDPKIVRFK